ncbi:MAG: hypothetical protein SFV51_18335, partial [Bryobacteraceae bacterium]|nr:hypothetical protein [Bryobacteraceae bacterium]
LDAQRAGEIVFAGAGRVAGDTLADMPAAPANLRLLPVRAALENVGLRKITVRRAARDPEIWEVFVSARNYGTRPRVLPITVMFGGAPIGARRLTAAPNSDVSANVEFRTKAAGWMDVRIETNDALPADDVATLELPGEQAQRIVVYSNEPELLRPLLLASRRVETVFRRPQEYKPDPQAGIVILDRFQPAGAMGQNAIFIEPPAATSPVRVRTTRQNAALRWRSDQFLAAGLRTKDINLENTQVFAGQASDIVVAEVDGGPVILARDGKAKLAVFGFHPMRSSLRYELATPLVFANIITWMAPEIFRRVEVQAGSVGTVSAPLESDHDAAAIQITSEQNTNLPFTVRDRVLRFFSGAPGTVRARIGNRELVYSLTLPEVADARWEAPKTVRTGFANAGGGFAAARDIWQWLAALGALVLLAEWLLFGRSSPFQAGGGNLLRFPWSSPQEQPRRKAS